MNMHSSDIAVCIVVAIVALYWGWARYCHHRWPLPPESEPFDDK